jgi:hypothetical protein
VITPRHSHPTPAPRSSWTTFWFAAVDPVGLHVLRVLAGLLFLAWLLPFMGHEQAFFGTQGWFDLEAYRAAGRLPADAAAPVPLGWSALYLCGGNALLLRAAYWLAIAVLVLFTLGVATRLTAVLTWVVVVSFAANPAISYDADSLLGIFAFYLMAGYLLFGQWDGKLSLLERLLGPAGTWLFARRPEGGPRPSRAANLAVRLLQVHFAIVIVVSGFHKLQMGDWWSGVAFWYPLHPAFATTPQEIASLVPYRESYLGWLSLAVYAALAWQIGFPFFAWRRRWRVVLLGGAVLGWLGTALVYRLPVFGPVLFLGCLSYLTPAEWRFVLGLPGWLARLGTPARDSEAATAETVRLGTRS